MKNKVFICFGTVILMFLYSCETLNVEPSDFVAPDYYYNTEEDLNFALTGIYDVIANDNLFGANGLLDAFDSADEQYYRSAGLVVKRPTSNDVDASYIGLLNMWTPIWRGIERANMFLHFMGNADVSEEVKTVIEGQVRFLRAYFYFILVQNWGDVPLKTTPTLSPNDINIARTPSSEIYSFIYDEMVAAEGMVNPITAYNYAGRVTKSAVQGILARVCLFWAGHPNNNTEKYNDALMWAEKVIQSDQHALNPDYSQVFINLIQDKYDLQESIWEIEYYTTGITDRYEIGSLGWSNGIAQTIIEYGYGVGHYKAQEIFYRKFEENDTRRDWAIAPLYYKNKSNPPVKIYWSSNSIYDRNIGKWRREYELTADKHKNNTGTNFPLLRYSDVLLMAAEAENEVNGSTAKAHSYLNEVRQRAGASLINDISSKDDFREIIQDERSRELCFEGYRRLDLVRWGVFVSTMEDLVNYINTTAPSNKIKNAITAARNVSERNNLLPIPASELALNKLLTQNPGY